MLFDHKLVTSTGFTNLINANLIIIMSQKAKLELCIGNHTQSISTVTHPKASRTDNPVIDANKN